MSKPIERVEVITGRERRRRYSAEEKVRLVEETTRPGMTVSAVAGAEAVMLASDRPFPQHGHDRFGIGVLGVLTSSEARSSPHRVPVLGRRIGRSSRPHARL